MGFDDLEIYFSNPEERDLALKLEKIVMSKMKTNLKRGRGDNCKYIIKIGENISDSVKKYLLYKLNKCSHTAKDIGKGKLQTEYHIH